MAGTVTPIARGRSRKVAGHHTKERRRVMHVLVDRAMDAWPMMDRWAADMARGFPSSTLGDGGSRSTGGEDGKSTLVEAQALGDSDPAKQAILWLEQLDKVQAQLVELDRRRMAFLRATDAEVASMQERQNSVEICADCGGPAPDVHRIDGQPYCATSCYHRVRRARQKASGHGEVTGGWAGGSELTSAEAAELVVQTMQTQPPTCENEPAA